jgi:hypothetical protein
LPEQLHALAPNICPWNHSSFKDTRLKRCGFNASGGTPYGFDSKRSRTNATVVSAYSVAVATGRERAAVLKGASPNGPYPVNDLRSLSITSRWSFAYSSAASWVDAVLASEEHQYVAIDRRAADGAALDVASGLECFLKHRHAIRLSLEENKAAWRSIPPAVLPRGRSVGQFPVPITLSFSRRAATKLAR